MIINLKITYKYNDYEHGTGHVHVSAGRDKCNILKHLAVNVAVTSPISENQLLY